MIRKLQNSEYLKRVEKMALAERQAYKDRVGQWLRSGGRLLASRLDDSDARLQNVLTASVSWNDAECQAFEEGVRLLSALVNSADTWLPDLLYVKSARRAIRQITVALDAVLSMGVSTDKRTDTTANQKAEEESSTKAREETEVVRTDSVPTGAGTATQTTTDEKTAEKPTGTVTAILPRPKHIDQYVHLLPAKTQERAAKVKDLLRELDYAREKARLLMESPQASPDDRAAWAKKATSCDNAVRSIYKELDTEWEKLVKSGLIEVDVFGNARVAPDGKPSGTAEDQNKPELTSEQKQRRRELRKWLIDTRRGSEGKAREKRIEQWKENWKEYLTLEPLDAALKDEKIIAAAGHFGIEIMAAPQSSNVKQKPAEEKQDGKESDKGQPTKQR